MEHEIKSEVIHITFEQKQNEKEGNRSRLSPAALELLKWLFGTLLLGVVGIIINNRIQKTELQIKGMEVDGKLIDAVSTKFDTSETAQFRYLKYIQPFITTDNLRVAVQRALDTLQKKLTFIKDETDRLVKKNSERLAENLSPEQREALLKQSQAFVQNNVNQKPIAEAKRSEDSIVGDKKTIDSAALQVIEEAKIITTPKVIENYQLIGLPQTKWCKKGYYVEFNNLIRIGINDLSTAGQSINVNIKNIEAALANPLLVSDNVIIPVSQTHTLDLNKYRHQITLNYIGPAGKNPFTKAAYITVATYKKP